MKYEDCFDEDPSILKFAKYSDNNNKNFETLKWQINYILLTEYDRLIYNISSGVNGYLGRGPLKFLSLLGSFNLINYLDN